MRRKYSLGLHWPLLLLSVLLSVVGFAVLYSGAGGNFQPWALPQMIRFGFGVLAMLFIAALPLGAILFLAFPFYLLTIALLLFVDIFGVVGMGAQRWIDLGFFVLQPSEPTKLAVILLLARYYHRMNFEYVGRITLLIPPLLIVAVPAALILLQPNLGTTVILIGTAGAILFAAGVRWWKFALVIGGAVTAAPIVWSFVLHDYQKRRVNTFLDPESDPLGAGYNILQSEIAIGSGGFWGRGFLQGSQSQLDFLPEKHTDFVFTMLAEEFGLWGSLLLLLSYALLLLCCYRIAFSSNHQFGRLVAIGIGSYFFLHIFINMAMVMGMIPVVGVPLPFLSYGGTTLLTSQLAIGLLLNMYRHREQKLQRIS